MLIKMLKIRYKNLSCCSFSCIQNLYKCCRNFKFYDNMCYIISLFCVFTTSYLAAISISNCSNFYL